MAQSHGLHRSSAFCATVLLGTFLFCSDGPARSAALAIGWERLAEGLAIGVWNPSSSCQDVPPLIALEIDPARYRFSVHHYRNEPVPDPLDIHEWQVRTGHDLVFNAGLFRENFAYLGLLYGNGQPLGSKRHGSWLGLFVAEPTGSGGQAAGILDLAADSFDEQRPPYREAAQSLMLLDRTGKIRVKQTGKQAQQTIVAEEETGHILVLKTTAVASLHAIGQCLHDTYPGIRQAMAMDGGSSSDLSISPLLLRAAGQIAGAHPWMSLLNAGTTGHIGLPAVIGISPRGNTVKP
jgi:uncharacterized protein YigE (DUF2233 family)